MTAALNLPIEPCGPIIEMRLHTELRPLRRLMTRTTSATTSSKWIRPPATWRLNPRSHRTRSITKIVQSIFVLLGSSLKLNLEANLNLEVLPLSFCYAFPNAFPHSKQDRRDRGVIRL